MDALLNGGEVGVYQVGLSPTERRRLGGWPGGVPPPLLEFGRFGCFDGDVPR